MIEAGDLAPVALGKVTGRRVMVMDEDGAVTGGQAFGPEHGQPVMLLRRGTAGGHYLGTAAAADDRGHHADPSHTDLPDADPSDTDMPDADLSGRDGDSPGPWEVRRLLSASPASTPEPAPGVLPASSEPSWGEPSWGEPTVRRLDQGRVETTWAQEPAGQDEEVQVIPRMVQHRLEPNPAMDNAFPWRDPDDPFGRVYWPYAAKDGSVHGRVRARAGRITARMVVGQQTLRAIAADRNDSRLPPVVVREAPELWPRLEQAVTDEIVRLIRGESLASPVVRPGRITEAHVNLRERPHEGVLVGQWGLFLNDWALAASDVDRPSLRNGRILGVYLGAVLDDPGAKETWRRTYTNAPDYAMFVTGGSDFPGSTISSEGAANAIAFANTAVVPNPRPADAARTARRRPGQRRRVSQDRTAMIYDRERINAVFVNFAIHMRDRDGNNRWQLIAALVALDNAFDRHANPHGMIIVAYGKDYLPFFDTVIKPESED
jgi:hypothetical protein